MKLKNNTTLFSALLWFHLKLLCFLIHRVKKCSRHNTRSECPTHVSHPRFLKPRSDGFRFFQPQGGRFQPAVAVNPVCSSPYAWGGAETSAHVKVKVTSMTRHKRRYKKVQCSPCFLPDAAKITVIAVKLEPGWLHSIFLTISIKVFMIGEHLKGGFVW